MANREERLEQRLHVPSDDLGRRSLISAAALLILAAIAFLVSAYGGHAPVIYGIILFASGVVELIDQQFARGTRRERRAGLEGLISCAAGLFLVFQVGISGRPVALAIAVFFIVNGGFRLLLAAIDRYPRWAWDAGYGVVMVALGIYMLSSLSQMTPALVSALIGVELILRAVAIEGRDMALRKTLVRETRTPA